MLGVRRTAIQKIGQIIAVRIFEVADANSDQTEAGGADFMREEVTACGKDARSELGRGPRARALVRILKSALLSFSVTVEPARALAFSLVETRSVNSHRYCSSGRNSPMSRSKVVSAETLFVSRSGSTVR